MRGGSCGFGCIAIALVIFGLTGCSGKPSERDARTVMENMCARDGDARVRSFSKVNATTSSMFGQEIYTVQFTATMEYLMDSPGSLFSSEHKKGDVETMKDGQLMFTKTEKGWQGMDGKIY